MICIEKYIPKFLDILYDEEILNNVSLTEIRDMFHTNQIQSKTKQYLPLMLLVKRKYSIIHRVVAWCTY